MSKGTRQSKYRRIVVKVSGESLRGGTTNGNSIKTKMVRQIAGDLRAAQRLGTEVSVVVGGGNIWRGATGKNKGMDRAQADSMGMLATVINAIGLQDALEQLGCDTRVMSAIRIDQLVEPYIRRRAIRHLEKDRIVIFAGGIGNPMFTTDSTVVQRAIEIGADIALAAKSGVDGVYTADPKIDSSAERLKHVSLDEALRRGYRVMDGTAFAQAAAHGLPIYVYDGDTPGVLQDVLLGKRVGTLVHP